MIWTNKDLMSSRPFIAATRATINLKTDCFGVVTTKLEDGAGGLGKKKAAVILSDGLLAISNRL